MQLTFQFQKILFNQGFTMCDLEVIKNAKTNSPVQGEKCCFMKAKVKLQHGTTLPAQKLRTLSYATFSTCDVKEQTRRKEQGTGRIR